MYESMRDVADEFILNFSAVHQIFCSSCTVTTANRRHHRRLEHYTAQIEFCKARIFKVCDNTISIDFVCTTITTYIVSPRIERIYASSDTF